MNRIYKIIKNRKTGLWMVCSEVAHSRGGKSTSVASVIMAATLPLLALAQVQPSVRLQAGQQATAYVAPNGKTTVLNINAPTARGLSQNLFTTYNVDAAGLVLNNANLGMGITAQSTLAGELLTNPNLSKSATTILNEVVSTQRSVLNGFTEVLGSKAAVVVANPNGITCNGCGFINTDMVTMSTGVPVVTSGVLSGLRVTAGDITVEGTGLNVSGIPLLTLLSRNLVVQGPINAQALDVRVGARQYALDPDTTVITGSTAIAGTGTAPTYAIDSALIGGMYADTIRLVSTDAGVGVRMLNDVATKAGDFTLTADGKIELGGKITSAAHLNVNSTSSASGANFADAALQLHNASLTSVGNTSVQVTGQVQIEGGQLFAEGNSNWTVGALKDRTTDSLQVSNNQRFAAGNLGITSAGVVDVALTNWKSGGNLNVAGSQIEVGTSGTQFGSSGNMGFQATQQDINLGQSQLKADGSVTLQAARDINVSSGGGQGVQSTASGLSITAVRNLNNAGAIEAQTQGQIDVASLSNQGSITLSKVSSANDSVVTHANLTNTSAGTLMSSGSLAVTTTGTLLNSGLIQSAKGSTVNAGNLTQDVSGAKWLMATSGAGSSSVTVNQTLSNTGLLQAGNSLDVHAATLTQAAASARILGAMSGAGLLSVTTTNAYNNPAVLYSGQDLSVTGPSITNATTGLWGAARNVSLTSTSGVLANYGAIYAGQDLTATGATEIDNYITYHTVTERPLGVNRSGQLVSASKQVLDTTATVDVGRDASFNAPVFINSSEIRSGRNLAVTAGQILNQVQGGGGIVWTGDGTSGQGLDYVSNSVSSTSYSFPDQYKTIQTTETWHRDQYFVNGTPALKPLMSATQNMSLSGFTVGKNMGGVLQANQIDITGAGGSTFLNDALALQRESFTRVTNESIHYIALGPYTYSDDVVTGAPSMVPSAVNFWPVGAPTSDNVGASIRAVGALNINVGALTNRGSVLPNTSYAGASPSSPVTAGQSGPAAAAPIPGLNLTLPTNPNGYFVTNRKPGAKYLVESNPLFTTGGSTLGSDYLMQQLNLDPNTTQKRLGDASYESYLVQQQLIAQTGNSLLDGAADMANVMQGLLDNAVSQAKDLGLTYGKAPTAEQLSGLTENIVWMVEVEVNGEKVLAPVVYLAPVTRAAIDNGATIVASQATIEVETLMNAGGSLKGSDSLNVTAKGDITNLSGTIGGGNVSLTSTEGSIKNETFSTGSGGDTIYQTTLGKTASIESTGNLSLSAKQDIVNRGAQMSAGGDASLNAGNNITFDTIENKTTTTYVGTVSNGGVGGTESSSTTTVNQVKSGLTIGGNLQSKAGNDITLAGTDAKVGGNADIDAGGNLNIVARENTVTSSSKSTVAGMGVGGGVYGTSETTTDSFSSRNVGSTLDIGGNANLSAGQTMTVQGSKLNVGGDTSIAATDVQVLAGKDVDRTTSTTKTTSFLQIENVGGPAEGSSSSGSQSNSGSETGTNAGDGAVGANASASAGASAEAGAGYTASAGVTLAKSVVTTSSSLSQRSVGSELNLGGNVTIRAKNDVTLQGSQLNAGGDVDLQATNVNLLAAQNIEQTSTSTTTTRLGLYASTENQAGASANANASASAGANASASSNGAQSNSANASASGSAAAGADANASASSKNTVDVLRVDMTSKETLNITNTGSAIKSGGNMNLNVANNLRLQGSSVEADGNVDLKATNMTFEAAQDVSYSKETSSTMRMGVYLDAGASSDAKANANADASANASASNSGAAGSVEGKASASASAGAEANAKAKVGAGIQVKVDSTTTEEGSTTAVVSSIKSNSGSVSRTATGTITDVGTNIEAAKDFSQSANKIESFAAENTQFSKTTTESNTARIGVYAEADGSASAKASAEASAGAGTGTTGNSADASASASASAKAEGGARVGTEMTFERSTSTTTTQASQAVTSNIRVGGNINSSSKEATTLQGTNMQAGGQVNLSASELNVLAARDTFSTSTTSETVAGRVATSVGVGGEASAKASASTKDGASASANAEGGIQVGIELSASYSKDQSSESGTRAVTANISGGSININTTGKTTLEGTNLNAGDGGVNIAAQSLDFKAAQDTYQASSSSLSVEAELKGKINIGTMNGSAEGQASVGTSSSDMSGTNAVVGSINSTGGLNIRTTDNLRLEGTQVNVGGDTNISAGGSVSVEAARSTFQASSSSVKVGAGFDTGDAAFNASVKVENSSESGSQATVSNISSGGSLNITAGKNASFEGTNIAAGGDAQIAAAGDVTFKEARNEYASQSSSVGVSVGVGTSEDKNDLDGTQSSTSSFNAGVEVSVAKSNSSEAVTGSIQAGNRLNVVSGGNTTFVGTDLAAGNGIGVAAGGNVEFKAAESTSSSFSVGVTAGIGTEDKTTTKQDPNAKEEGNMASFFKKDDGAGAAEKKDDEPADPSSFKKESSIEAKGSLDLAVASSTQQKGSNLSAGAGGIQISSGGNVAMQGTQMQTDGAASVAAAGTVTQTAAVSTSVGFGIGLSGGVKKETSSGTLGDDDAGDKGAAADAKGADAKAADTKAADTKADAPAADDKKPAAADGDKSGAAWKDSDEQPTTGLTNLTLSVNSSTTRTTIAAAGGSTVRSGVAPSAPIPGVSMTLSASVQSDGSMKALIPVPSSLPPGTQVAATQPDGKPLPDWVKFDAATGTLSGQPPADYAGGVSIVVSVPQANGTVQKVGIQF